jgi:hypothetical protein
VEKALSLARTGAFFSSQGTPLSEAPDRQRADQVLLRGVRLPYWKFPRNPEQ